MSQQHFVLRWHYQETTLLSGLPKLLDSELFTDITLSVGGGLHNIKAHRVVLATCSSYFLQLFQDMGPLQHPVIILQDTDFNDLNAIISFIYRGQCLVTEKQLPSVLAAAKLLQIRGLCDLKVPETKPNSTIINEEVTKPNSTNDEIMIKTDFKPSDNDTYTNKSCDNTSTIIENNKLISNMSELETIDTKWKTNIKNNNNNSSKCFICGKYLSNQYNLRVHMETHEDGYHACVSCPHVSRSRDALRKHISYRHPDENTSRKRKFKVNT